MTSTLTRRLATVGGMLGIAVLAGIGSASADVSHQHGDASAFRHVQTSASWFEHSAGRGHDYCSDRYDHARHDGFGYERDHRYNLDRYDHGRRNDRFECSR